MLLDRLQLSLLSAVIADGVAPSVPPC